LHPGAQSQSPKCEKHGGGRQRLELDEAQSIVESPPEELLALDEALRRFEEKAQAVGS